jgi:aspartokinase
MRSVQSVLDDTINENELLQFGMTNQLFNLSQLAKYLQPSIQVRAKKPVSEGSLVMALSRFQRATKPKKRSAPKPQSFEFQNIQVASNLCIQSFTATKERRLSVAGLLKDLQAYGRFVSVTHSLSQITLFFGEEDLPRVKQHIKVKPLQSLESVSVIGAIFNERYAFCPGLFNAVFQHLYIQGINVLEVSSTFMELLIFVHERDTQLAFDTLYARFVRGYGKQR